MTCGVSAQNREFGRTRDLVFKTTAIDHSAIPPSPSFHIFRAIRADRSVRAFGELRRLYLARDNFSGRIICRPKSRKPYVEWRSSAC